MAVDIYVTSQMVVQTAAQWAADTTVYNNKRILVTSDATYGTTDQRKIKIADGTQTWSQLDYFPAGVDGSGTANQISYWVDSDTQGALTTATYPSLTELSYVKGVTSAVQTQIDTKTTLAAVNAQNLSSFAATTSAQLAGVISDETGSGALVFANTPTLVTPVIGAATGTSLQLSGLTASLILATDASKNLVSLATTSYPSLTELSFVKGVTSSIQAQIDAAGNYTFSTGLTNTADTITANVSTGVSGGQTIIGGTAASNNLTISSTSNATKGQIILGSSSSYNEVNDTLGVGTTAAISTTKVLIKGTDSSASASSLRCTNAANTAVFEVLNLPGRFKAGDSSGSIYFGTNSGLSAGTQSNNCVFGMRSGANITSSNYNTIVGINSGTMTTGGDNSIFGTECGNGLGNGSGNVLIGTYAATAGNPSSSVIIGWGASQFNAASNSTIIGTLAARSCSGQNNTFIGKDCATAHTSGTLNVAIGGGSLYSSSTCSNTVAIGQNSMDSATTGTSNTSVGYYSGATLTTGSYSVCLGASADVNSGTLASCIAIGFGATTTASNQLVIGSVSSTSYITNAYLGSGVSCTLAQATTFGGVTLQTTGITAGVADQSAAASTFTIAGSKGTGTGTGGDVVIQVAPAGGSGSSQNSLVDLTKFKGDGKGVEVYTRVDPAASVTDGWIMYSKDIVAGNAAPHFRTENADIVKLFKGAALTTALTTVTCSAPGTPDYAVQDLALAGYGFVTADEGQSVLKVIANLQTRVNELETRLQASGQLT